MRGAAGLWAVCYVPEKKFQMQRVGEVFVKMSPTVRKDSNRHKLQRRVGKTANHRENSMNMEFIINLNAGVPQLKMEIYIYIGPF